MDTKRRPGYRRSLERKQRELEIERRDLEGIERRGFVHDSDKQGTQRRLREIRKDLKRIAEELSDDDE